jgi:hypothetical protein
MAGVCARTRYHLAVSSVLQKLVVGVTVCQGRGVQLEERKNELRTWAFWLPGKGEENAIDDLIVKPPPR